MVEEEQMWLDRGVKTEFHAWDQYNANPARGSQGIGSSSCAFIQAHIILDLLAHVDHSASASWLGLLAGWKACIRPISCKVLGNGVRAASATSQSSEGPISRPAIGIMCIHERGHKRPRALHKIPPSGDDGEPAAAPLFSAGCKSTGV